MLLDGRKVSQSLLEKVRLEIAQIHGVPPTLAVVLVGKNPASLSYIHMKEKRANEVGMRCHIKTFEIDISQQQLEAEVRALSKDTNTHGIIVQLPLPKHINAFALTECIAAQKDVDGFSRSQIGNVFLERDGLWSCTPKGIMTLLHAYNISLKGMRMTVIGRSNLVGKPLALMAINAGATLTSCNSHTKNIADITRQSDIIVIAIGKPGFLTKEMVGPKAIIIDVGSNYVDGRFVGDADFAALHDYVHAITPSPGGVGPMTVAILIENTWKAYTMQQDKSAQVR